MPPTVRHNDQTETVPLIDAANVIGSRPTGWWRDRPGAAKSFVDQVRIASEAGHLTDPVIVLEGKFRSGVPAGVVDSVQVIHAPGSGDEKMIEVISDASDPVTLVTADRELRRRAEAIGAEVVGPSWLLEILDQS
jgi:hypothetical protein